MKVIGQIIILGAMLFGQVAMADITRSANGKPCYATEKTYFNEDGVTPYLCAPASGPAYTFKVYAGESLIWNGDLPSNKTEVSFALSNSGHSLPRLVLRRDLTADPNGYVLRFGEARIVTFTNVKGEGVDINFPEVTEIGMSFQMDISRGARDVHIGKLPGAVVNGNDYRILVQLK